MELGAQGFVLFARHTVGKLEHKVQQILLGFSNKETGSSDLLAMRGRGSRDSRASALKRIRIVNYKNSLFQLLSLGEFISPVQTLPHFIFPGKVEETRLRCDEQQEKGAQLSVKWHSG